MREIPAGLRYAPSHEWIRLEENNEAVIGISNRAQEALGDIVFVELPEIGLKISAGDEMGVVESVKAASDIYAPLSGEVLAINDQLEEAPETVNQDPYGDGWLVRLKLADTSELKDLLDAQAYGDLCSAED